MIDIEVAADTDDELGECIVWDHEYQCLWWTDIDSCKLYSSRPGDPNGADSYVMPGRVGSFGLGTDKRLILAMEMSFCLFYPEGGRIDTIKSIEGEPRNHRLNDGRCDPVGRFLAGSINLARDAATSKLWQISTSGDVRIVGTDIVTSNGLAFSANGRKMWWADSPNRRIFVFDYDPETGDALNQRLFCDGRCAPGRPDGAAVDTDGCYWSARWAGGSIVRYTPSGIVDRIIGLPVSNPTMCAFGGPDLKTLFISTAKVGVDPNQLKLEPLAGKVLAVRPGQQGLVENRHRVTV